MSRSLLILALAASIATAASAADSTHTAASLNAVQSVTLGEMVAVEAATLLLTARSASDKLPVAFVSYAREDSSIKVDVMAEQWQRRPSVEDAKEAIEAYRKLLEALVIPRVNKAHDVAIDESHFVLTYNKGAKELLVYANGTYVLSD